MGEGCSRSNGLDGRLGLGRPSSNKRQRGAQCGLGSFPSHHQVIRYAIWIDVNFV